MARLGLDFGTTNSAIAVYSDGQLRMLPADPKNENPFVTPSLIYFDRQGAVTVGTDAAQRYLEAETGREVRWRPQEAADLEITVASFEGDPIEFVQTINVLVDDAAQGRLLQSIKTALFNDRYEGTQIFSKFYRIEEIISIILTYLKDASEKQLGERCTQIMMGRPVQFSHNPVADSRAEAILLKAAYMAGFEDILFELEPVAIAHLQHNTLNRRQTVLIFDFGGGTLDLTVARIGGSTPPEILATQGVLVGGNDLDRRIMESLLPYFGAGDDSQLPPEVHDKLLAWQTMPELSQPHYIERIHTLKQNSLAPYKALETLVTRNLGFKLFKEIERVKRELSDHESATLRFEYENIQINHPMSRRRFERLINTEVDMVRQGLEQVIDKADLQADDIDIVLRTGGSSRVPIFYELLADMFGEERQQATDPLVSVVGGFAISAHEADKTAAQRRINPKTLVASIKNHRQNEYETYNISVGERCYQDRNFVVNRIPYALDLLPAIRLANHDYEATDAAFLHIHLQRAADVFIAYEATATHLPQWLRRFEVEPVQIEIIDKFALISRKMRVFKRRYPAGQVTLGGNQAVGYDGNVIVNYLIILKPVA